MSPTARSIAFLKENGWLVDTVERWIPGANIRKDCFGCFDLLACRPEEAALIQVTSDSNVSARLKKIEESEMVAKVRECGVFTLLIHGWKGSKLRVVDVS